ncbi:hypothetical protein CTI12_AA455430 [Artemisia annua]|uniref:Uncharacterized protein n=1 Tax=Artemisia annua TaxID=35608 RepID=A0A2U1LTP8_ARTAN|nr:hypothetical protein CTI12_AA455430 [Artemisia annua]
MATRSLSSTITNSYSFSNMNINEKEWVESMRKSVVEYEEESEENPVCIFSVPQVLLATDPESYIPQQVALGPFHHWRPEVYDMQRYKLAAARRTQKFMNVSFERIVEIMKKNDEARIRACYHKSIDMSGDALIWMMAVDMAFLLEFLQVYSIKEEGRTLKKVKSMMSHVVDVTGKKLSHMVILRDVVMVENQIPMFLIHTMLKHQIKNTNDEDKSADETLKSMLMGLYIELAPFQEKVLPDVDINDCDHLLDFLYHMTVPNNKELGITEIISNIPLLKLMKEPMERMLEKFQGGGEEKSEEEGGELKAPTIEEITIPSVTDMAQAGILISPVYGGISDISFDNITSTLYLPVVDLDVNTEVYLRNLVAYEACVAAGPLVVARYTELMNGIVDTEEDAKFLRERGVILNHLKSDKEVADLWNGMSKSVKLTKVPKMDKVIEDVNKRYAQTWKVKFANFMNTYVFGSWKFLTVLVAIVMLLLTALQSFCSVYSCARMFHQLPDFQGGTTD